MKLGLKIKDTTRRHLGVGVLQSWTTYERGLKRGRYARVKFASGIRFVRAENVVRHFVFSLEDWRAMQ